MNKKLFLAGVALLAAVGFTSCNSETPIDPSTPSGIAPTTVGHRVGVDYDWAVKAKDVAQYDEYWAADKDAVQALVKDKNTASICFIADGFTLENKQIYIPELWADAKGKVVNVRIAGTFKNPDFLRADFMKNGAKATKFPVDINTKYVKGAEVNFTFDEANEFDFQLNTEYTRSTLNGPYVIGYFLAQGADYMSSVEIQSGTVMAIDYASTGDIKEKEDAFVTGVWTKGTKVVKVEKKNNAYGIYVGKNNYIKAENVFVEDNADNAEGVTIDNLAWNKDASKTFKLGFVKVQNPNKDVTVTFASDHIYASTIAGSKASKNFFEIKNYSAIPGKATTTIDLDYVDEVSSITVKGKSTLIQDVYTDVIFKDSITFATDEVDLFNEVTFNGLTVNIHADDVTVMFDEVNFNDKPTLSSTLKYEKTEAWTEYHTYQWIVSDSDPTKGKYVECKNDLSDLKEYNKTKEKGNFAVKDVQWDGVDNFTGSKAAEAKTYAVVIIATPHAAGTYTLTPFGTVVDLDGTCKFLLGKDYAQNIAALNNIWGEKEFKDEGAWYTVQFADTEYIWRKLNGSKYYVLVLE